VECLDQREDVVLAVETGLDWRLQVLDGRELPDRLVADPDLPQTGQLISDGVDDHLLFALEFLATLLG
jgi:hypothetical protein